jgi:hypothetical protein
MTPEKDADTRPFGIRAFLDDLIAGDPDERLKLGDLGGNLGRRTFGMLLFLATLPAFIPIPGVAGALSGPLVVLIGVQLLLLMKKLWLPAFIARRGPQRSTVIRFERLSDRWLRWLETVVRPRLIGMIEHPVATVFTGAQLVLLGLLLGLPIPFTNMLFGALLLVYAGAHGARMDRRYHHHLDIRSGLDRVRDDVDRAHPCLALSTTGICGTALLCDQPINKGPAPDRDARR